ncbi:hypothetical protein [Candidatus Mycoplasma haematominutum]|uniref:Uncharacterized protein n=1 Tax=Candidatus Mycoplasma haematominutum 'Birmingham 1' TaxID=1116213 RepID=G8C3D6_9MOLU|nr:hypothetical protein [Candidatus Mycoplasma haematominutum]CCE66834.1 hypothetical protein MHM_03160 [Candidatus Mycoplasma haematominutum 'Birmingham 1']
MSFFPLAKAAPIFGGLTLASVAPLSQAIPENFAERTFQLSNCVMTNWNNNQATVFKCLQEQDGTAWAFYLNSQWNTWFYGSSRSGQSGTSGRSSSGLQGNTTLKIEKGHFEIVVSSGGEGGQSKKLEVVQVENQNGKVRAYAPSSVNKEPKNANLHTQLQSSLQSIEQEASKNTSAPSR